VTLVKLPDTVSDDQAILISDIFPTGYFGAHMADVKLGHTVCVWGCGPVGIFAVISARLFGAGRIFAVDQHPDRLEMARRQGAETIDFSAGGPRRDAQAAHRRDRAGLGHRRGRRGVRAPALGARRRAGRPARGQFQEEIDAMAPDRVSSGEQWRPGGAPSQVSRWAVESLAKAGTLSIIGVYPPSGAVDPVGVLSEIDTMSGANEAFDRRDAGWLKVELEVATS